MSSEGPEHAGLAHEAQAPGEDSVILKTFTEDPKQGKWIHSLRFGFPVFHEEIVPGLNFSPLFPLHLPRSRDRGEQASSKQIPAASPVA